ncbi:MAG: hypothetical protein EZS28_053665, partial [Streblomastix strix]
KNGAQATDVLLANGDSKPISDIAGDEFVAKTGKILQVEQGLLRYGGQPDNESESEESDDDDYQTKWEIQQAYVNKTQMETITGRKTFKNDQLEIQPTCTYANVKISLRFILNAGTTTSFAAITSGNIQLCPTATRYDDGLRIFRSDSNTGNATIQLGCSRTSHQCY